MGAGVVELTAANADVASLTICGARLALTVISADVRRAAGEIGITFSAQGFTCLGIALALQSHVWEIAAATVFADHSVKSVSAALFICSTSIASCHVHVREIAAATVIADHLISAAFTTVSTSITSLHVHVRKRFTMAVLADKFSRRTATRVTTSIAISNTKDKS